MSCRRLASSRRRRAGSELGGQPFGRCFEISDGKLVEAAEGEKEIPWRLFETVPDHCHRNVAAVPISNRAPQTALAARKLDDVTHRLNGAEDRAQPLQQPLRRHFRVQPGILEPMLLALLAPRKHFATGARSEHDEESHSEPAGGVSPRAARRPATTSTQASPPRNAALRQDVGSAKGHLHEWLESSSKMGDR